MKRNIYIILAIFCIFSLIAIQSTVIKPQLVPNEPILSINKENIKNSPYLPIFVILTTIYATMILAGIINLAIFAIRKHRNESILSTEEKEKKFILSEKTSSKLLFLISFIMLCMHIGIIVLNKLKIPFLYNLPLALNMGLQISVILLIIHYVNKKILGLQINKKHLIVSLQVYTAILPLTLISLLLNTLIAEKMGIKYSINPAIEIFFLLKNKISISILIIQVILLGPIAEELFFRGFIYKLIRTRYSFILSAALSSIFFSLIHKVPYNILPLFVLSLGLCYLYEKTQNILAPIILHSIHNFMSLCLVLVIKGFS